MRCTKCGAELAPGDKFCGECGAPRLQRSPEQSRGVPSRFAEAERRFATLHAGYQAGELDRAAYEAELQKLIVTDSSGGYWMLGADGGGWYWYDGQQWLRRDPPQAGRAVERPQVWPKPSPAAFPVMSAAPPTKRELPWKWIAVGCGGLLVVTVVVIGTLAVAGLLPWISAPLEPTVALRQPFDVAQDKAQDTVVPAEPTATPVLPMDTPTPVPPTYTTTATPLPAAMPTIEGLLFYDDFSDPASGWETYAKEKGEVQYERGTLALVAKGPDGEADAVLPGVQAQDFSLSIEAELMSDSGDWAYGVLFRYAPGGNAYVFTLTADGQYAVDEFVDGKPVKLVNDTSSEAIETSGVNRINIHAIGPMLAFYVNGEQLTQITEAQAREGSVELWTYVQSEQEVKVAFDNLVVLEPTAAGEIAELPMAMPTVEPTALPTPTPQPQDTVLPPVYTEKLDSIPDLMQTDPDADLPGGGTQYCAPVSASNSLMWLAGHGFDSLSPDSANQGEAQAAVARTLGSERYMDVNLESGTGPTGVLRGLSRYIKDQGYPYQSLGYQGWRKHPARFSTGVEVPEIEWLKEGLMGYSGVWLNIGWYQYDSSADQYERVGGHWITLVGYGVDRNGNEDPSVLIIHDPGTKSGRDLVHEYVRVELIDSGRLRGEQDGLPRSAVGYYRLVGDLHVRTDADFGILDGAVVLKMGEPTAASGPVLPVEPVPPHTVLLYSDDFSGPNSGWGSKVDENRERGYENGEYVVLIKQEKWLTWTWGSNATFSDFTLEADARWMEGPESARFGLIFRHQDNDNFYYFLISGEGKYTIRKRQDGEWQSVEDLHWVPLPHIEVGIATHHFKVVCFGTKFSLYANGQHLITVQDDASDEGKVGLIVEAVTGSDPIRVAFDNLSVYGPGQ
jgi:hypothetical protein